MVKVIPPIPEIHGTYVIENCNEIDRPKMRIHIETEVDPDVGSSRLQELKTNVLLGFSYRVTLLCLKYNFRFIYNATAPSKSHIMKQTLCSVR